MLAPDFTSMDAVSMAVSRAGLTGTARGVAASACDMFPRRDPDEVCAAVATLVGRRDLSHVRNPTAYARAMLPSIDLELSRLVEWPV